MDWLNILQQVFDVCLIPLLGVATSALIVFIKEKMAESKARSDSEITIKYLNLLEQTVIDCINATNQTYVNALKEQGAFDVTAQKQALDRTVQAVINILSDDAKKYITNFAGDLETYIKEKIEANIAKTK